MNLGLALTRLGGRESGPNKRKGSASAYREALKETKGTTPYWHRIVQENLVRVNALLAQRRAALVKGAKFKKSESQLRSIRQRQNWLAIRMFREV